MHFQTRLNSQRTHHRPIGLDTEIGLVQHYSKNHTAIIGLAERFNSSGSAVKGQLSAHNRPGDCIPDLRGGKTNGWKTSYIEHIFYNISLNL